MLEQAYRSGTHRPGLDDLPPSQLLAQVPDAAIADLLAVTRILAGDGGGQLAALGSPAILAPMFVEHWADGDLILGGTLVDCKVTKDPAFKPEAFHQVLAYTLLDYGNWYDLDAVGIYLARQGRLVRWPLELILTATGDPHVTIAELREEFSEVLYAAFGPPLFHRWSVLPPSEPIRSAAFWPLSSGRKLG